MKKAKLYALAISIILLFGMVGCSLPDDESKNISKSTEQIYLYGEIHGEEEILERELELWNDHYHKEGMRHLFIEYPCYTAEFLNIWMKSDNDDILDSLYDDWEGTAAHVPCEKDFFKQIKMDCPETIFHGTDIGHHFATGDRYLEYLLENGLENSEQYSLVQETIEKGRYFYDNLDYAFRENKMAENFIREFDLLDGESVMGIYGGAHTDIEAMDYLTGSVPCMANQLNEHYGDIVHSEDLTWIRKGTELNEIVTIEVGGKDYEAIYIGKRIWYGFAEYKYREIWCLENAYNDFKENRKTGNILPYSDYPISIETCQVFLIDFIEADGDTLRMYFRSDGNQIEGELITEEFKLK